MKKDKANLNQSTSLIELFQEELKSQLKNFDELLRKLLASGPNDLIFDQIIRCAHSIKGAAKLINLDPVVLISNGIEVLFRAYNEKTVSLADSHLVTLFNCSKLLQILVQSVTSDFKKILEEKNEAFIKLSSELEQFLSNGYIEREKNEQSSLNIQNNRIENFLKNLKIEVRFLAEGISHLRTDFENHEILGEMTSVSENIKKIGETINLPIVIQLGEALETCFRAAFNQQLIWTQGHMDLIVEAIGFLQHLSECNSYGMQSWLTKHEKGIEAIACVILAISKEASSIPVKKKEKRDEKKIEKEDVDSGIAVGSFFYDSTMLDLFYGELEQRVIELNQGILLLEDQSNDPKTLESLMRAAHSLKGAARIVDLSLISQLAHSLEDFFTSLQNTPTEIQEDQINELFNAVDLFTRLSQISYNNIQSWIKENSNQIGKVFISLSNMAENPKRKFISNDEKKLLSKPASQKFNKIQKNSISETYHENKKTFVKEHSQKNQPKKDSFLRVSATNLNRLMGLAGESLVESRWLVPFSESLISIRQEQNKLASDFNALYAEVSGEGLYSGIKDQVSYLKQQLHNSQAKLSERLQEFDLFIRRQSNLSDRLYSEVINSRMRPLADGIEAFPRLVRDLAKQLKKKIRFIVEGENTTVDREILEKLEAPLNHLLRNAVDHGIESQSERLAAGKSEVGTIRLRAYHKAGTLIITVSDDGRGVNLEALRKKIINEGFVSSTIAERLNESELLEFMFIPGFSSSKEVTEISGRGIGLNVVQNMVQEVGGWIKTYLDGGLVIQMQLPLTLSVIRALLVEISEEVYAIPLVRINKVIMLPKENIYSIENNHYFHSEGKNIALIHAYQVLELSPSQPSFFSYCVVIISKGSREYGLIVDKFISEKEIVIQELDPILGKVQDILGGAFMEDGSPLLIIDIEDVLMSIENKITENCKSEFYDLLEKKQKDKKILLIDDSSTVREAESLLLQNEGYQVTTATNGLEGWKALQLDNYDLIITDIDMPQMNGIELIKMIRSESKFVNLPIMIISYKENEKDKLQGLDAGANFYLTKNSFHDEGLIVIVNDLIEMKGINKK